MKLNKKIIITSLIIIILGSIASITAHNTISKDKKATVTGEWDKSRYTVSGYVKDNASGEPIPNAEMKVMTREWNEIGYRTIDYTDTDEKGYYSLMNNDFNGKYVYSIDVWLIHPDYGNSYIVLY